MILTIIKLVCFFSAAINAVPFWSATLLSEAMDAEVYLNATAIIRMHGYDAEEHYVETEDGYILCLIRMRNLSAPFRGKTRTVFMQHGLLDSSHTWINNLNNQSLGFILADNGYDVWLGNSRGSTYSKKHKRLTPDQDEFWNFSWDQMAEYDLPACIQYVLKESGSSKIGYVGHSQGTQIAFAQFNRDPELQSRISVFVALAPVAYLGHVESPVRWIVPFATVMKRAVEFFSHGEFMPTSKLLRFLALTMCPKHHLPRLCTNIIYLFAGFDPKNTNTSRVPVYVAHTPAGTSAQNIVHYCQSMSTDRFQHFDYGSQTNQEIYGQPNPPRYDLSRLHIPIALYHGGNDWLAVPRDVMKLVDQINRTVISQVYFEHYNHLDFVWGLDAGYILYPSVLDVLSRY